jgi:hypothetical protein
LDKLPSINLSSLRLDEMFTAPHCDERLLGCSTPTTQKRTEHGMAMEGWQFGNAPDGWTWRYVHPESGEEKKSTRAFATLHECIKDARSNGYDHAGDRERKKSV